MDAVISSCANGTEQPTAGSKGLQLRALLNATSTTACRWALDVPLPSAEVHNPIIGKTSVINCVAPVCGNDSVGLDEPSPAKVNSKAPGVNNVASLISRQASGYAAGRTNRV
jgi:hypothetical protein